MSDSFFVWGPAQLLASRRSIATGPRTRPSPRGADAPSFASCRRRAPRIRYAPPVSARLRLGLLASGSGSNVRALIDASERGDLTATIAVVISNNSGAGALEHARRSGIPTRHLSTTTCADVDAAIRDTLVEHDVHVVALAGYLKLVGPSVLSTYEGRIVNIHPGPLPRFGGRGMFGHHVHRAVLAAGVPESGPTVHLVDAHYDQGPALAHRPVPVHADDTPDTLASRVLAAEHDLYWRVIQSHFVDRITS